jgi:hypothetical protein
VSIISGRSCPDKEKKMGCDENMAVAKKAIFLLKRFFATKKNITSVMMARKSA